MMKVTLKELRQMIREALDAPMATFVTCYALVDPDEQVVVGLYNDEREAKLAKVRLLGKVHSKFDELWLVKVNRVNIG